MRKTTVIALAAAFAAALARPAAADNWDARAENGICYAVAFPAEGSPSAYVSVTHRPAEGIRNEVAFVSGLSNTDDVTGRAEIDGQTFTLLVNEGAGFVSSGPVEDSLIKAMKSGRALVVSWANDTEVRRVQTYSLKGFSAALLRIDASCAR